MRRVCHHQKKGDSDRDYTVPNFSLGSQLKESDVPFLQKHFDTHHEWSTFGVIDTTTNSKPKYYNIQSNEDRSSQCPPQDCPEPKFVDCMPTYWRTKLNGILDLSEYGFYPFNRRQSWLLLFNNQSMPVFCIVDKNNTFTEGVRLELN